MVIVIDLLISDMVDENSLVDIVIIDCSQLYVC